MIRYIFTSAIILMNLWLFVPARAGDGHSTVTPSTSIHKSTPTLRAENGDILFDGAADTLAFSIAGIDTITIVDAPEMSSTVINDNTRFTVILYAPNGIPSGHIASVDICRVTLMDVLFADGGAAVEGTTYSSDSCTILLPIIRTDHE